MNDRTFRVKDGKQLERFLQELAKGAVEDAIQGREAEAEKQYQANLEKKISATVPHAPNDVETKKKEADIDTIVKGDSAEPDRPEPEKSLKSSPDRSDQVDLTPEDITVDAVVDKLNIIRSGQSLKDPAISEEMDKYVRGLEDAQRIALYGFLKSIGQIVAADVSGDSVKEPEDEPYDVMMQRVRGLEAKRKEHQKHSEFSRQEMDRRLAQSQQSQSEKSHPDEEKPMKKRSSEDRTPPVRVRR